MASPIPLQNIYYLLAYAWNRLPESEIVDVSNLESQELADLFAAVLINGIRHLLRRGLDQSYISEDAEIAAIRGRVNIGITMRRMLLAHGHAHCEFDELRVDTLPNQILRATAKSLTRARNLDAELKKKLRGLDRELGGISDVPVNRGMFRTVQLYSNNRFYRFLLSICELVLTMSLIDEANGHYRFRDFVRDDKAMARLFESFVFNFFRLERPDLNIRKERIYWEASSTSDPEFRFLPTMETDISIRDKPHTKTLIIDTKFYKETFTTRYDKEKIHSANLYQMVAYLRNLQRRNGPDSRASGILLYPVTEKSVRLGYTLNDHSVQICTLNLNAYWKSVRDELRAIQSAVFLE